MPLHEFWPLVYVEAASQRHNKQEAAQIAREIRRMVQVARALPHLQALDDVKLGQPLSPVSKLVTSHTAVTPQPPAWQSSSLHTNSAMLSAQQSTQRPGSLVAFAESLHTIHVNGNPGRNGRHVANVRRPASAGGAPQRLPPVASGRNQPGSFLLHSLALEPSGDPLLAALLDPQQARVTYQPSPGTRVSRDGDPNVHNADANDHGGSRVVPSRLVRPASAGIRRPGTAAAETPAQASSRCSWSLHSHGCWLFCRMLPAACILFLPRRRLGS